MELVMQPTEHQRVAVLRKQRIATLLGEINVHLVGNGPAMVCWPSLMMTGQMWRGRGQAFSMGNNKSLVRPPLCRGNDTLIHHCNLLQCVTPVNHIPGPV